jgi:hypothetical protein
LFIVDGVLFNLDGALACHEQVGQKMERDPDLDKESGEQPPGRQSV